MKLLCLPIAFLYAVVKGQLMPKHLASHRNADPRYGGWSARVSQQLGCRKLSGLVERFVKRDRTQNEKTECTTRRMENSGFEPLTSTLQK